MLYDLRQLVNLVIISQYVFYCKRLLVSLCPPSPPTFCETLSIENEMFEIVNNMCYLCINKNLKVLIMGPMYGSTNDKQHEQSKFN
jgi:hypothetical protein